MKFNFAIRKEESESKPVFKLYLEETAEGEVTLYGYVEGDPLQYQALIRFGNNHAPELCSHVNPQLGMPVDVGGFLILTKEEC